MRDRIFLTLLIFILLVSSVSAQGMIISNSNDWRDVFSVELFGRLEGIDTKFLTGTRHAAILHYSLPTNDLEIIASSDSPIVIGYDIILQGQGFSDIIELAYDNVNLELARRLTDISKFIIVDDSYGYNALAAASFASMAGYYILFADDRNIGEVVDFLEGLNVDDLIIFGQVDREVREDLADFNPEIINTGDRFDNNIEIVKKYLELKPTTQIVLSNGEFIEQSLINGADPVLFIGKNNVPDPIKKFIQESNIDIGVLIGNELIGTASVIKREVGISVFVKFAQGARTPGGAISAVEDLDRFPMPSYTLNLEVFSVFYNQASGFLEVTFRNLGEIAIYLKSTINILAGDQVVVAGDIEPVFIDGEEFKTILYAIEPLEQTDNITAEISTIFGESKKSLEFLLRVTLHVETITILDASKINITDLYYDEGAKAFYLEVENSGEVDTFVDAEIVDLWVNGQFITVGGDSVISLKPEKKGKIKVSIELVEEDITYRSNQELDVRALFGQRENALVNIKRATFAFTLKEADYTIYALIGVVVILLILILFKRRKKS